MMLGLRMVAVLLLLPLGWLSDWSAPGCCAVTLMSCC